jgi:hypothetical protein
VSKGIPHIVLNQLGFLDGIAGERVRLDSASIRARRGSNATSPKPTDRREHGSNYHLVTNQRGVPLAACVSVANVHDSKLLEPIIDAIPPL